MVAEPLDVREMKVPSFQRTLRSIRIGGLVLTALLSGCSKSAHAPPQRPAPPVAPVSEATANHSMDAPGLTMPQRLQLLNASINPDEVLYQNRRKAARLRTLVEAEKDPSLRAFLL